MLLVAVAISVTSSTRSFLIRCKGLSRLVCPVLRLRLQVRRESLLQHFVDQAAELQPHQLPVHILSDIDMTVWVGTFGAGGARARLHAPTLHSSQVDRSFRRVPSPALFRSSPLWVAA